MTNMTEPEPCRACKNDGWLLIFNTDSDAFEIQRCGGCCRYPSDDKARAAIATDKSSLITVLFQIRSALLREVDKTVDNASTTKHEMKRLLALIRDSLQSAIDLRITT
ncbi:MAG: hypothetical protein HUU46_19235 [Candidatus Hydrogenedentes bacterium]|nr:hypothetical protein [Candidatus Hydrogenedentota bacterium]